MLNVDPLSMKLSAILLTLESALTTWSRTHRGSPAAIAQTPGHLFDILANAPTGIRCTLWTPSGDTRSSSDDSENNIEDPRINVVVSRPKQMTLTPNAALTKETGQEPAFLDLLEECRDLVRNLKFDEVSTEVYATYLGYEILTDPNGVPYDAYQLKFQLGRELPPQPTE